MLKVERLKSFDEIQAGEWNALLEGSKEDFIFQSFEFQSIWWKYFGIPDKKKELFLLAVRKNGILIGIAPLMLDFIPVIKKPVIRFIGTPIADYVDFIVSSPFKKQITEAFYGFIKKYDFFEIDLKFIPENSPILEYKKGKALEQDLCPYVALQEEWDNVYKTFRKSLRQDIRRCENNLSRKGNILFKIASQTEEIDGFFKKYVDIHIKRWKEYANKYSQFQYESWIKFAVELAKILLPKGYIDLSYLSVNSEIVAAHFGFIYKKRFYYYMPTFNPEFAKYSPSKLLIKNLMKYYSRGGAAIFDFLRGAEPYKLAWTDKTNNIFNYIDYPDKLFLNLLARFLRGTRNIYAGHIKNRIKKIKPVMRFWYKSKPCRH